MKRILLRAMAVLAALLVGIAGIGRYAYYRMFEGGGDVFELSPPELPAKLAPTAILIFTKTNGYRNESSIVASRQALIAIAADQGWSACATENGAVFNPLQLSRFRAVIWDNTSGNNLLPRQRAAFEQYMESGGGFVGIHGAGGDPTYVWRWYVETLIGAQFKGHPLLPQFQPALIRIEDRDDPATRHLPATWSRTDEWYSFESSPRGKVHVLASLDENTYTPRMGWKDVRMGADHPIVWKHCVGHGRAFYSALGHTPQSYAESAYVKLLTGAIRWAAGLEADGCAKVPSTAGVQYGELWD